MRPSTIHFASAIALLIALLNTSSTFAADTPAASTPPAKLAVPAWASKDPSTWPPFLLTNKQTSPDNHFGFGGSSALVRLPNNVVVLMTASHLLGDVKAIDFAKGFKSWQAVPIPSATATGPKMGSIAMDVSQPSPNDALVLLPTSQSGPWPATVLPARQAPLQVGDVVYLVGISDEGSKDRQAVHKGAITKIRDDGTLEYAAEGTFKTTGNSGAPVLDAQGHYAGINTSHLNDQTLPGHMLLVMADVTAVMREIKLPATMKPLVLTTQPAAAKPENSAAAGKSTDEAEAEKLMMMAQVGTQQGFPPEAIKQMYQQVIDKYPNTAEAKQAKTALAAMH